MIRETQKMRARALSIAMTAAALVFTAVPAMASHDGGTSWGSGSGSDSPWRGGDEKDLNVIALTERQRLILFKAGRPDEARELAPISGLVAPDGVLIGIDYRVQDASLYGVGNGGGIYMINPSNGVASKASQLTVALAGSSFGVDFNPAANALRITSDTGQNLRHPFAGATAGQTQVDGNLNYAGVVATGITGSAYVNNDLDANTGTTLFALDTALNQLAVQSPPNAGTLVATGKLTVDPEASVGFDIYSTIRNNVAVDNVGFASLRVGGQSGFYMVDMLTGKAARLGAVREPLVDIAIPLGQL